MPDAKSVERAGRPLLRQRIVRKPGEAASRADAGPEASAAPPPRRPAPPPRSRRPAPAAAPAGRPAAAPAPGPAAGSTTCTGCRCRSCSSWPRRRASTSTPA